MRKPNVRAFATLISPFPVFWVCQDLVLIPAHPAAPEQRGFTAKLETQQ
jgi:hypothetical protein